MRPLGKIMSYCNAHRKYNKAFRTKLFQTYCNSRYGSFVGRCNSFIGRNVVFLCSHVNWQFDDFVCGNVSLNSYEFLHKFYSRVEMMIGLLLSFWRRFFVSGMMIVEYSLVMAEVCQRQN